MRPTKSNPSISRFFHFGLRNKAAEMTSKLGMALFLVVILCPSLAKSQEQELAKKLSNPISSLISVPFQYNYDCCFGPSQGNRNTLNIQPVIPIKLDQDWNLIVRTIVPVVSWQEPAPTVGNHSGFGDVVQSFFFSPNAPTSNGIIWGVGPVFLYPTASDAALGSGKWGAGPTAVLLKQQSGWTVGVLVNHLWSFAGESDRSTISNTFLQPFVNYTFPDTFGITFNTESTYDWVARRWTVPLNLQFSKIFKFGPLPVSLAIGPRYYVETPPNGPKWGVRFAATLLFPTK
jgi:hypothetical protein